MILLNWAGYSCLNSLDGIRLEFFIAIREKCTTQNISSLANFGVLHGVSPTSRPFESSTTWFSCFIFRFLNMWMQPRRHIAQKHRLPTATAATSSAFKSPKKFRASNSFSLSCALRIVRLWRSLRPCRVLLNSSMVPKSDYCSFFYCTGC